MKYKEKHMEKQGLGTYSSERSIPVPYLGLQALTDEVTGGINKIDFRMKYHELCRKGEADQFAVALLDCVDFKAIHDCGFRCALDDFGVGFSSLTLLKTNY